MEIRIHNMHSNMYFIIKINKLDGIRYRRQEITLRIS